MDIKKKVFIYFRFSSEIGYGHLSRARALLEILKNDFDVKLLTTSNTNEETLEDQIVFFPDVKKMLAHVEKQESSILIVDDYKAIDDQKLDLLWARKDLSGQKLVFVIDYEKRPYNVDLILSPTGAQATLNSKVKSFTWPEYSLVSQFFSTKKPEIFQQSALWCALVEQILLE